MERVVVGVDRSAHAEAALAWSADLAARAGAELVAARAFEPTQAELPPERDVELHDEELAELEQWCERRATGVTRRRSLLLDGGPADALLSLATKEAADLLVVGGRGAGGFADLHLGSVAHHLAHHTTVPLAIVPQQGSGPVRHLVLGLDGSDASLGAVRMCADLAAALSVAVTAVYALEPVVEWVPEDDPRSWHTRAEAEVRRWATPIEETGTPLEVTVDRESHPVAAIGRALESHPGSAAVVGTRGLGGFSGLRLGRVPLQLVHHTGAATILVPA